MKTEILIPEEAIPVDEMYHLEWLVKMPTPGIYKLTYGWDRAFFCEIGEDKEPIIYDGCNCSNIRNPYYDIKAVKVNMPCCMLVRMWDWKRDAKEFIDEKITPCGEFKNWGIKEYEDVDINRLVKLYAPILMKFQQRTELK